MAVLYFLILEWRLRYGACYRRLPKGDITSDHLLARISSNFIMDYWPKTDRPFRSWWRSSMKLCSPTRIRSSKLLGIKADHPWCRGSQRLLRVWDIYFIQTVRHDVGAEGFRESRNWLNDSEKFGERGPKLEEPLGWVITYPIQWRDPRVNLAELAKLRWIESWSREALAKRYGKSVDAIQCYFQHLKRKDFLNVGLTPKEVKTIKKTISKWSRTTSKTNILNP